MDFLVKETDIKNISEITENISLESSKKYIDLLKLLYKIRFLDEKMAVMVKQNKGSTFFLSVKGHEMIGAVCGSSLIAKKDWSFPYYRDRAFAVALGSTLEEIIAAFLARDTKNHSSGRMMPDHFSHKERRIPCQSSCVGSQYLQAVGLAKGIKNDEVVYVSGGDGSTSQGDFHEALNYSAIHKLPIIFVIQDNDYAISVTKKEQTAGSSIAKIASGFENLSVFEIDGTSYFESKYAVDKAISKARQKDGPSIIIAKVPRINSHTISDDQKKYRSPEEIDAQAKRDPIIIFEKLLLEKKIISQDEIEKLKTQIKQEVEAASIEAEKIPFPKSETAADRIFKEFSVETSEEKLGEPVVMMDAINHAIAEEMQRDEGVVIFGEDVGGNKGGVFGITRGLTDRFGKDRCFNTPLAESTIIGLAIGLSFDGFHKPIAEIQFADYTFPAFNQLLNELASIYYRSNGEWNCPVVVRIPYGGYIQGGPYHSQSIETFLCHVPGLKVVVPSNAKDAKRLLKTAIRDPNPVVFLEHKALYRQRVFCAQEEPSSDELLEFGKANIVVEGKEATIVTYGMMTLFAKEIADKLKQENISIEVIDLRTLNPLDLDSILNSIKKTNKLLIVHEAVKTCGFAAEIMAQVMEKGFKYLDAPIVRVCAKDCMVPYAQNLENEILPQKKDLEAAIRKLVNY